MERAEFVKFTEPGPVQCEIITEDDMGTGTKLRMQIQQDGDVVIGLYNDEFPAGLSVEFCTSSGGGMNPEFTKILRKAIFDALEVARKDEMRFGIYSERE